MEAIIDSMGPSPPKQQINHTADTFSELTKVYHELYAGALSAFFESRYFYFTEDGKMTFPKDPQLIECVASFLKLLSLVATNEALGRAYCDVMETRVVWQLARTTEQVPSNTRSPRVVLPTWNDPYEVKQRVHVVEALLCDRSLAENPLTPPMHDNDIHRVRQFDFWHSLGEFLRQHDGFDGPVATKAREDNLKRMRVLLDGMESRDLIYSIAVYRDGRRKHPETNATQLLPQHLDETNPKFRVLVAGRYIQKQAQSDGGSTNVIRRMSGIAARVYMGGSNQSSPGAA